LLALSLSAVCLTVGVPRKGRRATEGESRALALRGLRDCSHLGLWWQVRGQLHILALLHIELGVTDIRNLP
jgi:hypothetical protein